MDASIFHVTNLKARLSFICTVCSVCVIFMPVDKSPLNRRFADQAILYLKDMS